MLLASSMPFIPTAAGQQGGVFSRRQAIDAGYSAKQIRFRLAAGAWLQPWPHVFHESARPPSERGLIHAAALATGGVISHWSAATINEMDVPAPRSPNDAHPHVTTQRKVHVNVPGIVEHRLRVFGEHTMEVEGLRVTRRDRTVVDLMAIMRRHDAESLLFRAVQQSWLDRDLLGHHISNRSGWYGTPQLRELMALLGTNAHASSERHAHAALDRASIPYDANVRIALPSGRVCVVDLLIRGTHIVVEIDGREFHSGAERFQRDRERQNALVNAGFTVLRFTWLDVTQREAYVIGAIRAEMERQAA